jgi:hypothetical protein
MGNIERYAPLLVGKLMNLWEILMCDERSSVDACCNNNHPFNPKQKLVICEGSNDDS